MPVNIDITASSMTGLLGAVEASKAKVSRRKAADTADEYNLSRFSKGSKISKASSHPKNSIERHHRGSNKGIKQRAAKDESEHLRMRSTKLAPSVAEQLVTDSLERKAKIYEATIRGRAGGLSEKQLEGCALNIEAKRAQQESTSVVISDSEEDEPQASGSDMPPLAFTGRLNLDRASALIPGAVQVMEEEDWIETQDEFGRTILIPAADVPPVTLDPQKTMSFLQTESANHLTEVRAEYGPQRSFPVLDPSEHPVKKSTADERVEQYFDPTAERRHLGTGYYAFSNDPVERQKQQDELRLRQAKTEHARAAEATDQVHLSDAERAIEQRKRQIQLKREELARKRLKPNLAIPASTTSGESALKSDR